MSIEVEVKKTFICDRCGSTSEGQPDPHYKVVRWVIRPYDMDIRLVDGESVTYYPVEESHGSDLCYDCNISFLAWMEEGEAHVHPG